MTDDDSKPKEEESATPDRFSQGLDELEAMSQAMRPADLPDPGDDFGERLAQYEAKVAEAKKLREGKKREAVRRAVSDQDSSRGLAVGMSIAYTIIGLPMFGWGVGWLIDKQLDSTGWKGLCMMVGAVAGLAFAMLILNRQADRR